MTDIEVDVWDREDEPKTKAQAEADAESVEAEPDENLPLKPLDQLIDTYKPDNLAQLCQNWVWVTGMERFLNRLNPTVQWKAKQFDTQFNYLTDKASVANVLFKKKQILRRYNSPIFLPGGGELHGQLYNLYRPSLIVPKEGDTSLWDTHIEWLLPNEADRNRLLVWMAWVLQNPHKRPCVALLLLGRITGTGKSFVARVFEQIIGETNTQRPKNSSLKGDFNPWAALCRLAIVEELCQIGKREVTHELRDMITEPTIEVNPKGINPYKIQNHIAMFGISNEPDALPIQRGDRRWEVVETLVTQEQKDQTVANGWFAEIMPKVDAEAKGGIDKDFCAAVAWKLLHADASSFKPGDASTSAAKTTMIELGEDDLQTWLAENENNDPLTRQFVNIQDDIIELIPPSIRPYKPNASIRKHLRDHKNGVPLGRDFRFGDKVQKLWAINEAGIEAKKERAAGKSHVDELLMKRAIISEVEADRALRKKKFARRSAADDFGHDPEPQ